MSKPSKPPYTTLAIGEEEPIYTTLMVGEEDDGPILTSEAYGEEDDPIYTTMAVGEEDGGDLIGGGDPFGA